MQRRRRAAVAELAEHSQRGETVGWDSLEEDEKDDEEVIQEGTLPTQKSVESTKDASVATDLTAGSEETDAALTEKEQSFGKEQPGNASSDGKLEPLNNKTAETSAPDAAAKPAGSQRPSSSWSVVSEGASGNSSPSTVEPLTSLAREEGGVKEEPHVEPQSSKKGRDDDEDDDWGDDWE